MIPELTPKSALLLAAITVSQVDGELDDNEVAIINRLDGFTTSEDWDVAIAFWNQSTLNECVSIVAKCLNPKQQRVAIANMIDIAMADGYFDEDENLLLRAYIKQFDVDDQDIEKIVDVLTIKNNNSVF